MTLISNDPAGVVLANNDIPASAASNNPALVSAQTVDDLGVGPGPATAQYDMWIRNGKFNYYLTNKDTRFENLVFAITAGYASSPEFWRTDAEFASRACALARSIAYEMAKFETT